ncbi:hypothetical protein KQX54_008804 [Cotesia glomerata]|uniref:Uncharacterized protein n=2 Tax=Cotesia glomerata TaxID=32391 RepID=A0AAV7IJI1_COTGL|nr:hypothetical protein KQX54_008804 [Cotesia glomerata]
MWRVELKLKDRRIYELEMEIQSIEDFLNSHSETNGIVELQKIIKKKLSKIHKLETTVAEFEDFLKQNPDVKELHDLKCQVDLKERRIRDLESWIERNGDVGIEKTRIIELEQMVTHLEEYVKSHNVDALKQKLQDREEKIEQLLKKIETLDKELMRREPIKNTNNLCDDELLNNFDDDEKMQIIKKVIYDKEVKMKEMEHAISEKDNSIQGYEQQVIELQDKIFKMVDEMKSMKIELSEYEAEDIGVLKEEIRVRDEKIQQLEEEIDSLERVFGDRMDLEEIEELLNVIKRKEEHQKQLELNLTKEKNENKELRAALRDSVAIANEAERKFKQTEKSKKDSIDRVKKLEQKGTTLQSTNALKCHSCRSLIKKFLKCEKNLKRLKDERRIQLKDLRHLRCESLKAALSEKDAHLALLELSAAKTVTQFDQMELLKADKARLLEELKKEDRKCIELSEEESSDSTTESTIVSKILEPTFVEDEDYLDNSQSVSETSR